MRKKLFLISFYILGFIAKVNSFPVDTSQINKKRFIPLATTVGIGYAATFITLGALWYKDTPKTSFHLFNDLPEWLQMDKVGHFTTSFHISYYSIEALKWSGVENKKAILWGSIAGFLLLTPVEIFDGFAPAYGASLTDIAANALGPALVITQYSLWNKIKIYPKFSFHPTKTASIRPNVLGSNLPEQILKDYNGQTYWLSFKISSFLKKENKFPNWLNLSIGYGGENMVYSRKEENRNAGFNSKRQFYLALDLDLTKIKTKIKVIDFLLYRLNIIHVPGPALELNKDGLRFHPIYF